MNTLGIRIANRRRELNLSQLEVADAVGIAVPNYNRIENGHSKPREKTLEKIAAILDMDVEDLYDDEEVAPYIAQAMERGGAEAANEVAELLQRNIAMLAGGKLSQRAKDSFYRAITDAYFDCKAESERRNSKK